MVFPPPPSFYIIPSLFLLSSLSHSLQRQSRWKKKPLIYLPWSLTGSLEARPTLYSHGRSYRQRSQRLSSDPIGRTTVILLRGILVRSPAVISTIIILFLFRRHILIIIIIHLRRHHRHSLRPFLLPLWTFLRATSLLDRKLVIPVYSIQIICFRFLLVTRPLLKAFLIRTLSLWGNRITWIRPWKQLVS